MPGIVSGIEQVSHNFPDIVILGDQNTQRFVAVRPFKEWLKSFFSASFGINLR